jgi:penicillin-binding protein 1A
MRRIKIAASVIVGVALGSVASLLKVLPDGDVLRKAVTSAQIVVPAEVLHAGDKVAFMASARCHCPTPIPYDDFPSHLVDALIATEDRRFFLHRGVDPFAIARATGSTFWSANAMGASTLSQQIAKNLVVGYEAAQAVGALQATTALNPERNPERAHRRAQHVLSRMVQEGFLSSQEAAAALKVGPQSGRLPLTTVPARYYLDWSYRELRRIAREGSLRGDVRFVLALDPATQLRAQRLITNSIAAARGQHVGQGALVAIRPNGQMVAIVGGLGFAETQLNRAVALRQPASAFKVFVYTAALEEGLSPTSLIADRPIREAWPRNVDGDCSGRSVTAEEALSRSLNCPAVQLAARIGPQAIAAQARKLGVTSELRLEPSIALGTSELSLIELTAAYATFANGGHRVRPHTAVLALGPVGQVTYTAPDEAEQVVSSGTADGMRQMLRASVTEGSSTGAALPHRMAYGKTGTSDGNRDAWFVGFTDELVAGVWVGNDDASPMAEITGPGLPATIWRRLQEGIRIHQLAPVPKPRPLLAGGSTHRRP